MRFFPWILVGGMLACQGVASEPDGEKIAEGTLPGYAGMPSDTGSTQNQQASAAGSMSGPGTSGGEPAEQTPGSATSAGSMEGGAMATELGSDEPADSSTNNSANNPANDAQSSDETPPAPAELNRILVFTRTLDYRHNSIGAGVQALTTLGQQTGFSVEQTEQPSDFNDANLAQFDVVVFLSTTANVLQADQEAAFERYIQADGGWVGIHAAADTEYGWAWYGGLLGGNAWFEDHPTGTPTATLLVDAQNASHRSTAHLDAVFEMQDEWYNYQVNPSADVTVLLRLDEGSYDPNDGASGGMGDDHPIAWYHTYDGGRAWYTGLGHRSEQYQDARFTAHLLGGLRWAAGLSN